MKNSLVSQQPILYFRKIERCLPLFSLEFTVVSEKLTALDTAILSYQSHNLNDCNERADLLCILLS